MNSFFAILKYELNQVLRGWLFRIFAILSTILLIILDIINFSTVSETPWMFAGHPAFPPYASMFMLNIGQTAILFFLATDAMKRDRKFNTQEVIFIRPVSTSLYIYAKATAVMSALLILDGLALLIVAIVHGLFGNTEFFLAPYFIYPVILILPTLIFAVGLSFATMLLVRVQPVALLLLFGFYGLSLFYLAEYAGHLLDFMCLFLPMLYSPQGGLPLASAVLAQRLVYVLLGFAMLQTAVLLFPRLAHSRREMIVSAVMVPLLLTAAAVPAAGYYFARQDGKELRARIMQSSQKLAGSRNWTVSEYNLQVAVDGGELQARSTMLVDSAGSGSDSLYFCLNPGLTVSRLLLDGHDTSFSRTDHIIRIPAPAVWPDSITVEYAGTINEEACYPEISDDRRQMGFRVWMYKIARQYSFVGDDYLLLSPEANWYPTTHLPRAALFPANGGSDFYRFRLTVSHAADFTAIAPGRVEQIDETRTRFVPEQPLQQMSLIIGEYETHRVEVDSVQYTLYNFPHSGKRLEMFDALGDSLQPLIREVRNDFERRLELTYPFRRFALVEVPLTFYQYGRIWTMGNEGLQPEQVWIGTNGTIVPESDFKKNEDFLQFRLSRNNQTLTDSEKQAQLLRIFFEGALIGKEGFGRWRRGGISTYYPDLNLFPLFYSYVTDLRYNDNPLLPVMLEGYYYDRVSEGTPASSRAGFRLTPEERVSRAMLKNTLSEMVTDTAIVGIRAEAMRLLGSFVFKLIKTDLSRDQSEQVNLSMNEYLADQRFRSSSLKPLFDRIEKIAGMQVDRFTTLTSRKFDLPAFAVDEIKMYRVKDMERVRYQVLFELENRSSSPAVADIIFSFRQGGRRRAMRESDEPEELKFTVFMDSLQRKRIGYLLDAAPQQLAVDGIIARNLPLIQVYEFDEAEEIRRATPFEGEVVIDTKTNRPPVSAVIVDNEEPGFHFVNPPYNSLLKQLISDGQVQEQQEFQRFQLWHPPNQWARVKNAGFYGIFIHSAYYIASGEDGKKAEWRVPLQEKGHYRVDTYFLNRNLALNRWQRDRSFGKWYYRLKHDDGEEVLEFDTDSANPGWNPLGEFYFSADTITVELLDKSTGEAVVADAVRFQKID